MTRKTYSYDLSFLTRDRWVSVLKDWLVNNYSDTGLIELSSDLYRKYSTQDILKGLKDVLALTFEARMSGDQGEDVLPTVPSHLILYLLKTVNKGLSILPDSSDKKGVLNTVLLSKNWVRIVQ